MVEAEQPSSEKTIPKNIEPVRLYMLIFNILNELLYVYLIYLFKINKSERHF